VAPGGSSTAIVMGGSIAGSFAARVLSDYFDRVIVVDRDEFPREPIARKGAMQGVHFHALLARGRIVAESLFPGFGDELVARGAPTFDASETRVYEPYGWGPVRAPGVTMVAASRLLIELAVRERAAAIPNVDVRTGTEATGLMMSDDGKRVCGVQIRAVDGDTAIAHPADLVVDASGRAALAAHWLPDLGFPEPETTTVNAFWGYASRFYRIPDGLTGPVVGGFPLGRAGSGPPATRGGFLLLQENDTWLVTLSGCAKDFPPGDEAGFLEFARSLAFPQIGDVIPHAEPLSPIRTWRNTVNRRRHFELVPRRPEGLIVISDAACSFNPIYGQGMSIASVEALDLQTELEAQRALAPDGGMDGIADRFASRLANTITYAWNAACRADYRVPGVEGADPPDGYLEALAYYDRVVALSRDDLAVYEKISRTNQLLCGPEWLDEPELRSKVAERWDELGATMGYES
jgi:2-polyprenyl-6-methoxyphenol hydroxylase-like FAD-dependent oxidoreductase